MIALVVVLKFLLPPLIVRFPFWVGWLNFLLDAIDGDVLIPLGLSDFAYQRIDKAADWVTYVFMVVAARDWPIRRWLVALFVFRSVGQALFFVTGDERLFFLFPNVMEPLFLLYATILVIEKDEARNFYLRHRIAIWTVALVYKLQDEWFLHVANIDRTDLVRGWLGL